MTSFQEASGKLLEEAWWKRGGSVVEARFGGIGSVKLPERQEAWILGRVRGSKFRKRDSMQASGKNPLEARFRGRNRGGGDASATLPKTANLCDSCGFERLLTIRESAKD